MPVEIVMPRMGLTMEEGRVVAWLKQENQPVTAGELLLEIETDKSTVEVESPASGILGQILYGPGETIPVGQVIGYLIKDGESASKIPVQPGIKSEQPVLAAADRTPAQISQQSYGKPKASPAARTLAQQLKVELADIAGTGPGGRVVAWNVKAYSEQLAAEIGAAKKISPLAKRMAAEQSVDLRTVQGTGLSGRVTRADVERALQNSPPAAPAAQPGEITQLTRSHRIMAERMSASFRSAPHFYLHVEVDMRGMVALRQKLQARLEKRYGIHLTFTDLLIRYCALVLKQHPKVMAQWSEQGLVQPGSVNVGVAMDAAGGLIVPVIQQADQLGLVEISRRRQELAERALAGSLQPQDLELGVFTLSNLGMYGIDSFDAILNPPQAAILAVGRIKERALVSEGTVIAAPVMTLSMSVDHRVMDGATAARFLGELVELIEAPELAQA
ncbi:MAG: 2-oxo acid dehydrogenase subunit E2 [Anaerolineaceae bacterium]|nr:2-oxo acid dehydrogenase subunit E2 [Anaerolineaceae bacterium]